MPEPVVSKSTFSRVFLGPRMSTTVSVHFVWPTETPLLVPGSRGDNKRSRGALPAGMVLYPDMSTCCAVVMVKSDAWYGDTDAAVEGWLSVKQGHKKGEGEQTI